MDRRELLQHNQDVVDAAKLALHDLANKLLNERGLKEVSIHLFKNQDQLSSRSHVVRAIS